MMMGPLLRTVTLVVDMVKMMVARTLADASSPFSDVGGFLIGRLRQGIAPLFLLAAIAASGCVWAQGAPGEGPGEALLAAMRAEVLKSTQAAPNHTCLLQVHRVQEKASLGQKMEEYARLEVAYLDGRERYSWPGAASFREDELRDILVMGLSGSGSFAEHIKSVVLGTDTVYGAPVEATDGAVAVLRIPYEVAAGRSGYLVNLDGKEIEAAIRGVITVRISDSAILAFTLEAVNLPPDFPATAVTESIRYQPTLLGSFRPPAEALQRMVEAGTDVYSNRYQYDSCREFRGDSTLRFDQQQEGDVARQKELEQTSGNASASPLPPRVPIELRLKSAIAWGKVQTGGVVEAELTRPVKFLGKVLADGGATVKGRLVEFKQLSGASGVGYYVGIQFETIEDKGNVIPVSLNLDSLTDMPKGSRRGIAAMVRGNTAPYELMERIRPDGTPYPAAGFIRVLGDPNGLPAGIAMRWVADDPERPAPNR